MKASQLNLEALGDRIVPTIVFTDHIVYVGGTDGADDVTVRYEDGDVVVTQKFDAGGSQFTLTGYYPASGPDFVNAVVFNGGNGDDTFHSYTDIDCIVDGGRGNDHIYGGDGNDTLYGNVGHDTVSGGGGSNSLSGDGGSGPTNRFDILGNDTVIGGDGVDWMYGGGGSDTMYGNGGDDVMFGDAGADTMYGGFGADKINGGAGDDTLNGGDPIFGTSDLATDKLTGDTGVDTFVFEPGASEPVFSDFTAGVDKKA